MTDSGQPSNLCFVDAVWVLLILGSVTFRQRYFYAAFLLGSVYFRSGFLGTGGIPLVRLLSMIIAVLLKIKLILGKKRCGYVRAKISASKLETGA